MDRIKAFPKNFGGFVSVRRMWKKYRRKIKWPKKISATPILVLALLFCVYKIGQYQTELQFRTNPSLLATQVQSNPAQVAQASPTPAPPPPVTSEDHARGGQNAKITIVEYSDLECPFCKQFHPVLQQALTDYGDNVKWVFRQFPLTQIHQNAEKEAEASECVNLLGGNDAFWKFVDTIYQRTTSNGTGFALTALGPLAAEVGVDQNQFQNCLDSGKFASTISDSINAGVAAGVGGTPTSFIVVNGKVVQVIPGALPYSQLKPMLDQLLKS